MRICRFNCLLHRSRRELGFFFQMLPFLWFLKAWVSTDDVQSIWVLACFSRSLDLYRPDLMQRLNLNWFQQFPDTSAATAGSHKHPVHTGRSSSSSCLWPQSAQELSHACRASRMSGKKELNHLYDVNIPSFILVASCRQNDLSA